MPPRERVMTQWVPTNAGLDNLGNTCFMNAGLQCLLHTTELTHPFLRGFYRPDINENNLLGCWGRGGCSGKLAEAFNLLVEQTHTHGQRRSGSIAVSPHFVKRRLTQADLFVGNYQHDSEELICCLLDRVHEDTNRIKQKPALEVLSFNGTDDALDAAEAARRHALRNDSLVDDVFNSQTRSGVTCNLCQKTSVTFDPTKCLSVAFETDAFGGVDASPTSLENMLRHFVTEETLTGSNAWRYVDRRDVDSKSYC